MTSVLQVDPDALEAAALGLRRAAAEVEVAARGVVGPTEVSWSGLAALEQAARRREACEAVGRLAAPLERVAAGLVEVALAAREKGETVRRHGRLRDQLAQERSRLVAAGAPPEPLAAERWAERVRTLHEECGRHQRLVQDAEEEFGRVRRRVEAVLDEIRSSVPQIVWDLGLTFMTVHKARKGWRQVAAAGAMVGTARRLQRAAVPGGERTLHRMRERVDAHVRRLRMEPPRWVSKVPGGATVAGRAVPVVALGDALHGTVTAGGYQGWRGSVTRGLAGGAVVGMVAVIVAPGAVAVGAVGLSAAAVYQAWMTGNWLYDNRGRIAHTAGRAWTGAARAGRGVWSGGRGLLTRARERATSGLDRLRRGPDTSVPGRREPSGRPVAPGPTVPAGAAVGAPA